MRLQKRVALISCTPQQLPTPHPAEELYTSALFKKSLAYARTLRPDKIFILSAEYGLLPLREVVAPYSKTLGKMRINERRAWGYDVLCALREECDLEQDHFVILAGATYRNYLTPYMQSYEVPMERLQIGRQLSF